MMKTVFFTCLIVFAAAEDASSTGEGDSSLADASSGYHQRIGVVEAERIRTKELIKPRIAGGYAAYDGEHPYMAGLLVNLTTGQTSVCGGALVSNQRVLTAASCWNDGYTRGKSILVVLGSIYLYSGGTRVYASSVHTHYSFNPYTPANDIAILNIPHVPISNTIKPLTLPYGTYVNSQYYGYTAEAVGYGSTLEGPGVSTSLRGVYLEILTYYACNTYYASAITNSGIICAKRSGYQGPCQGDMGGPLVLRFYNGTTQINMLIGVASFGLEKGCKTANPTVYSKVGSFISWINDHL